MAHPLLDEEGSTSPPRWLLTAARIVVQEAGESPKNTRRSRMSLSDGPSLCATIYTAGGVGELYQRRSVVATLCRHHPSGLGKSEGGWLPLRP
jgi:hypothetical protein